MHARNVLFSCMVFYPLSFSWGWNDKGQEKKTSHQVELVLAPLVALLAHTGTGTLLHDKQCAFS